MTDWKAHATVLLDEFNLCVKAKPKHNAVDIQLMKDSVGAWASQLATQRSWGTDVEIAEACYQLEPRLKQLKEHVTIEVLTHGTI